MRAVYSSLIIVLVSCGSHPPSGSSGEDLETLSEEKEVHSPGSKVGEIVIQIGMNFEEIKQKIVACGATETQIQIALPDPTENKSIEVFTLPEGPVIQFSLLRNDENSARIIDELHEVIWLDPGRTREKEFAAKKNVVVRCTK